LTMKGVPVMVGEAKRRTGGVRLSERDDSGIDWEKKPKGGRPQCVPHEMC